MSLRIHIATVAGLLASLTGPAWATGDPDQGQRLYQARCGACHSLDKNRIGPMHRGVFGRPAGSVGAFAYSEALRMTDIVWTEATLDRWLSDPETLVAGQRMFFRLKSPSDRADIIAFLKQESP